MRIFLLIALFSIFSFAQDEEPSLDELEDLKVEALNKVSKNPDGKDFWLCFMRNHTDSPKPNEANKLKLQLFITSDYDSKVTIEIEGLNYKKELEIPKGTVRNVELNPLAQITTSEVIERGRAVHVTSDNPVNVYGLNRRKLTTDTFLGLPVDVLGTEYLAIGYNIAIQLTSQFAIVATDDSTIVKISPSVYTAKGKKPNEVFEVILNKGDVYQVASAPKASSEKKADLTGTYVSTNKKVAFFSGHQCAYVPDNVHACNHLVEQVPPVNAWGTHYYIGRQKKRSKYTYRVLASEDQTKIFENYKLLKVLNKGEYIERLSSKDVQLTADHPVLVAQYSQGFKNGDSLGDPMMLLISPTQQFLTKYRFATPVNGFWEHYVNIVAPTSSLRSVKLDGKPIPRNRFKPFGTSRYSIAYLRVKFGTHELEGDLPFGMSSYGFGYDEDKFDAYGNIGGQSFIDYIPFEDTLAPSAEIRKIKNDYKLIVRDDRDNDKGLKSLKVLVASNFNFKEVNIDEGTPQVSINLGVANSGVLGSLLFETEDAAGNKIEYTVCYKLDPKTGTFRYFLNEGNIGCELDPSLSLSIFSKNAYMSHTADFSESGNISTPGTFNDGSNFNFGFGAMASYGLLPKLNISARLFVDRFSGELTASDTVLSQRRIGTELTDVQEATDLEIESYNINLGFSADYYFNSRFYVLGGLRLNFMLGNSVMVQRRLLIPNAATYSNGTKTSPFVNNGVAVEELTSLSNIGLGIFAGVGVSERIYNDISVFSEINFDYQINNLISDGNWSLWQFYINLGLKYPI